MVASLTRNVSAPPCKGSDSAQRVRAPTKPVKKVEWSGDYCVEVDAYSFKNVGKLALRNKFLQSRLDGAVRVQNTVAVPFGAIKQVMSSHHENGRPCGVINRALEKISKAREKGTATIDQEKNALRTCSRAARDMEIPAVMLDEIVDACVSSQMHVPCDLSGWERLRQGIAQAISLSFTASVFQEGGSVQSPLELPVGLLIKDQEPREYDFIATISADGEVTGEIKLPYSNDRGMRFVAEGDCIRTTGQPKPHLGAVRDTSPVVLDGVDLMEPLHMHHMAFSGGPTPPKLTLEGDNLLILPRHRQAVYRRVVHAANMVAERMGGSEPHGWVLTGFITPHTEAVVTDVQKEAALA
eukprot:jgi/Ulvmu1/7928/UM004_0160.1